MTHCFTVVFSNLYPELLIGCSRSYHNTRKEETDDGVIHAIGGCCHSNRVKGEADDVKFARIGPTLRQDLMEATTQLINRACLKLNEGYNQLVARHNNDVTDCRLGTIEGHKIFCGCTFVLDKKSHAHRDSKHNVRSLCGMMGPIVLNHSPDNI